MCIKKVENKIKTKEDKGVSRKAAFVLFMMLLLTAATFEILWLVQKEKYETLKTASVKLTLIQLAMTNSCIEYCNITSNKSLDIFKEYLYKEDFKHLREIENVTP